MILLFLVALGLSGCSIYQVDKYQNEAFEYCLKKPDDSEYVPGKMVFAEFERNYYKDQYEKKLKELDEVYNKFIKTYKKNMESGSISQSETEIAIGTLNESQKNFQNFAEKYGSENSFIYMRSYPYNYYGALLDILNLRIKHLKIHIAQFDSDSQPK
ncbi:MAG: hypothetical protein LBI26_03645 [Holosporales bacterium]|jgi:Skp family chaperone for outer membrane proteins|nr:hypothetical protein [Holosporales bacterium]